MIGRRAASAERKRRKSWCAALRSSQRFSSQDEVHLGVKWMFCGIGRNLENHHEQKKEPNVSIDVLFLGACAFASIERSQRYGVGALVQPDLEETPPAILVGRLDDLLRHGLLALPKRHQPEVARLVLDTVALP